MAVRGVDGVSRRWIEQSLDEVRAESRNIPECSEDNERFSNFVKGETAASEEKTARETGFSRQFVVKAIEDLNKAVDIFNKGLHFEIHEETDRIMVEVINKETGEVIRQIPPEYVLDVMARIDKLLGIFIDEWA